MNIVPSGQIKIVSEARANLLMYYNPCALTWLNSGYQPKQIIFERDQIDNNKAL